MKLNIGYIWETPKKRNIVIDINEESNSVLYSTTSKKTGKTKVIEQSIDKVISKIEEAEKKVEEKVEKIESFMINPDSLLLRDIPLKEGLSDKIESVFSFAIDHNKKTILIGNNKQDENPFWIKLENFIKIADKTFLKNISSASFKSDSVEDMEEKARAYLDSLK